MGLMFYVVDFYGYVGMVENGMGCCWFFKGMCFDFNSYGVLEIVNDKVYVVRFLKENGVVVLVELFVVSFDIIGCKGFLVYILDFVDIVGFLFYVKLNIGKEG